MYEKSGVTAVAMETLNFASYSERTECGMGLAMQDGERKEWVAAGPRETHGIKQ